MNNTEPESGAQKGCVQQPSEVKRRSVGVGVAVAVGVADGVWVGVGNGVTVAVGGMCVAEGTDTAVCRVGVAVSGAGSVAAARARSDVLVEVSAAVGDGFSADWARSAQLTSVTASSNTHDRAQCVSFRWIKRAMTDLTDPAATRWQSR